MLAEDPETAKFDGMPLSAIATGMVDYIGSPAELANWLMGTLFLGSSESLGSLSNEFLTIDESRKFYRKQRDVRLIEPKQLSAAGPSWTSPIA